VSTPLRDLLHPNELVANAILDTINHQRRILIVGTKSGNLPQWVADDARILLWPSDGPEIDKAPNLNGAIGVVLFFKWIGHRQHKRICDLAKGTQTYVHQPLLGTGEVRRLLQPLHPETPQPEVVTPPAGPKWEGSLFGFVEAHYEHGSERGHQTREGERLLRLAYKAGLTTTLASVTNTVGTVARGIERAREDERLRQTPVPPDVPELLAKVLDPAKVPTLTVTPGAQAALERVAATLPTAPAQTPSVAALVAAGATTEAAVDTSLTELLRMLDDAVAVLGLAREQLVGLSSQNAALRSSRQALRDKMLAVFEGI
jgi:hypothetical protein